jgi:hypothetical protein
LISSIRTLIIDRKARLFDAAGSSVVLTRGFRLEIGVIGLLAAAMLLGLAAAVPALEALVGDAGAADTTVAVTVTWPLQVLADAFGVAVAAATYFELDRRVDWIDEIAVG